MKKKWACQLIPDDAYSAINAGAEAVQVLPIIPWKRYSSLVIEISGKTAQKLNNSHLMLSEHGNL